MFAGGRGELQCDMFSSHGVVSRKHHTESWRVVVRAPRVYPAPSFPYYSLLFPTIPYYTTPHRLSLFFFNRISHLVIMAATETQRVGLQKLAYESSSKYLREHEDEVVEIEILPPAIAPPDGILMQDGLYLGVPKKILALAYVEARQQFFENRQHGPKSAAALQATKIMLLFDPEHLTAVNFRKLRLSRLGAKSNLSIGTAYHKALRQELCFLNSVLTSPLHRQSKSPTLWYHRFWMIDFLKTIELQNASDAQKADFWRDEIDAVFKSAEQHPKNYHAWRYARRLVNKIEGPNLKRNLTLRVREWCYRHPSDISGWSFFSHLMPRLESASLRELMVSGVADYAIRLRSEQESLWVFIRTTLALCKEHEAVYQMLQHYREELEAANRHDLALGRVSGALTWIDTYGSAQGRT
jgi:hypothetical protein